jgi:predicted porin
MRKIAIALAAMACCASASAQSSVTIFGVVDLGVARTNASGTGHASGMVFGGNAINRMGFRGTEDLGGGYAAGFWLEGQLNSDTGTGSTGGGLDFMRRSTVSLAGPFGEVRLGREFDPTYLTMVQYDPWGQRGFSAIETTGFGAAGVASYVRNSNGIHYLLPSNLGGLFGSVMYAFGEQPSSQNGAAISTVSAAAVTTRKTANYAGGRLGYDNGKLNVSGAYGKFMDAVRTVAGSTTTFYASDYTVANMGASYDFGFIKPLILLQQEKIDGRGTVAPFTYNTVAVSAAIPVGAGLIRVGYSRYDIKNSANDFNKMSLSYAYNLSKRTSLYASMGRIDNKGASRVAIGGVSGSVPSLAPAAGGTSTGFSMGMTHAF